MDAAYRQFRATRSFGALDGLRGLAILAVVWHHTGGTASHFPLLQHGFLGVDLFFVLSGFLIATLLLRERDERGDVALGRFYVRRALRIFPLYYAILATLAVALGLFRPESDFAAAFFRKLPYYLTYTSNWLPDATLLAVTWSLAAEEQFYATWPPLEKFARSTTRIALLVAFIGLNQAVNFQLLAEYWPAWLRESRPHLEILQITFTPIGLGVLLAHALHDRRCFARIDRVSSGVAASFAASAVLLAAASTPGDISGLPRLLVQLSVVWLLATCVVREDHALSAVCRFAPLRRIGIVSYGMYLLHMFASHPAKALLRRFDIESPTLLFVVCGVVTYAAAEASFRCWESRFLRWKRAFAAPAAEPAAEPPAVRGAAAV